jgi:hypothetical protein
MAPSPADLVRLFYDVLWRVTMVVGGCVGTQSQKCQLVGVGSSLSIPSEDGSDGSLTAAERQYAREIGCKGEAFPPPCTGWAFAACGRACPQSCRVGDAIPGSDLPSTYNHALWWTLEDMWEVVGSPPYNIATMVAFSLAKWMSRGLAAGRPGVGVASTTATTC